MSVLASVAEARASRGSSRVLAVVNAFISLAASVALAVAAATADAGTTLAAFGVWAVVSGALQLGAAAMRRRAGGRELPMIVSGAISIAAGASFVAGASQDVAQLTNLAGYAAFGAVFSSSGALAPRAPRRTDEFRRSRSSYALNDSSNDRRDRLWRR